MHGPIAVSVNRFFKKVGDGWRQSVALGDVLGVGNSARAPYADCRAARLNCGKKFQHERP